VNILFLTIEWPCSGGVETVTRVLSNAFINRGNNVCVCYFRKTVLEAEVNSAVKQFIFPVQSHILARDNIDFLKNILVENKINIVINQHSNQVEYAELAIKAKSNEQVCLITCTHGSFFKDIKSIFLHKKKYFFAQEKHANLLFRIPYCIYLYLKAYFRFKASEKVYDLSDRMVYLSNGYIEQIKQKYPKKNLNKLATIFNPIPKMPETDVNFSVKEKNLLFVGRMDEPTKRMSLILKFWEIICNKYPDWSLIFVGDGKDLEKTQELAKNLPRVHFEGFREPEEYYKKSPIFLMTSSTEGLPMTLIESQSFGCALIAMSSFASLPDIIQDGENGFIVPNNDLNIFTKKICLLMDNRDLREKMAKSGIESVKKFAIENVVDEWEKLFIEETL